VLPSPSFVRERQGLFEMFDESDRACQVQLLIFVTPTPSLWDLDVTLSDKINGMTNVVGYNNVRQRSRSAFSAAGPASRRP